MKNENYIKIEFLSKSCNEGFSRVAVAALASQLDPTLSEINEIKTAVSEAVTNCVVHAYPNNVGTVYITAKLKNNILTVTVKDKGVGISDIQQAMQPMFTTDVKTERAGLGFAVMQTFMDKIKVYSTVDKGTRVVMTKNIG